MMSLFFAFWQWYVIRRPERGSLMKYLKQLCKPRENVFDLKRRDTILDLADLVEEKINPAKFFEENYITEGMKILLEHAFRRLEGKSDQEVFRLKQAMGGGKTHNLLALGLLAMHPEYRKHVMGGFYKPAPDLGPVKVIAFSGRESNAPLGIWGRWLSKWESGNIFRTVTPLCRPRGKRPGKTFSRENGS